MRPRREGVMRVRYCHPSLPPRMITQRPHTAGETDRVLRVPLRLFIFFSDKAFPAGISFRFDTVVNTTLFHEHCTVTACCVMSKLRGIGTLSYAAMRPRRLPETHQSIQ